LSPASKIAVAPAFHPHGIARRRDAVAELVGIDLGELGPEKEDLR